MNKFITVMENGSVVCIIKMLLCFKSPVTHRQTNLFVV